MTLVARKIARGKCLYCGRLFVLTKRGRVRQHMTAPGVLCGGSGEVPAP